MSATKVYLVTGANRGIGLALVNEIASRHDNVVIYAGVRNPSSATALKELSTKFPGRIEIVKFVAGDEEVTQSLAKIIQEKYGYLDVVIPNAGIASYMGTVAETPASTMREFFEVNAVGVLLLFQAVFPLLKASKSTPRFIPISSGAGSLTAYIAMPFGNMAYGVSKAALNYITRKIHFENEWLVAFPLDPGLVTTDMSRESRELDKTGSLAQIQDAYQISPEKSASGLLKLIDNATREKEGGEFINAEGTKTSW